MSACFTIKQILRITLIVLYSIDHMEENLPVCYVKRSESLRCFFVQLWPDPGSVEERVAVTA